MLGLQRCTIYGLAHCRYLSVLSSPPSLYNCGGYIAVKAQYMCVGGWYSHHHHHHLKTRPNTNSLICVCSNHSAEDPHFSKCSMVLMLLCPPSPHLPRLSEINRQIAKKQHTFISILISVSCVCLLKNVLLIGNICLLLLNFG
jgi:hypothetical protein